MSDLQRLEALLDDAALAYRIAGLEAALPIGVRARQLRVRTFLLGAALCLDDGRPAYLVRVHEALCSLSEADRGRLGVVVEHKGRAHAVTYRQTEYLNHLLEKVLAKKERDGLPSTGLQDLLDALVDASVPARYKEASSGAILANGNCYCPATPKALFNLDPLPRGAAAEDTAAHDAKSAELARHKFGRVSSDDADGYQRVCCPAVAGKLRCPLWPASMRLDYSHPEVLEPPEHPPVCCSQQSFTVPPAVNAKTRQKHDYPGKAWRASYARRSAVERSNSRIKDPATIDVQKGWCRLVGLVGPSLFLAVALCCRNLALVDAFESRQAENERRRVNGLESETRRRRRKSLTELAGANAPP